MFTLEVEVLKGGGVMSGRCLAPEMNQVFFCEEEDLAERCLLLSRWFVAVLAKERETEECLPSTYGPGEGVEEVLGD